MKDLFKGRKSKDQGAEKEDENNEESRKKEKKKASMVYLPPFCVR